MIFLLSFLFFFQLHEAKAYTPPISYILNQMVKDRDGLKDLLLEGKITHLKSNAVFKEVFYLDFASGKASLSYFSPNEEPLGSMQISLKDLHRLGKFWIGMAIDPSPSRFKKSVEELNVVPKEKSIAKLSKLGTKVTWSWGEGSGIEIYKDEFLPAHYQSAAGEQAEEVFLKDYSSVSAAVRIPKTVLIKIHGSELYRFELKNMKINAGNKTAFESNPFNSLAVQEWMALVR